MLFCEACASEPRLIMDCRGRWLCGICFTLLGEWCDDCRELGKYDDDWDL